MATSCQTNGIKNITTLLTAILVHSTMWQPVIFLGGQTLSNQRQFIQVFLWQKHKKCAIVKTQTYLKQCQCHYGKSGVTRLLRAYECKHEYWFIYYVSHISPHKLTMKCVLKQSKLIKMTPYYLNHLLAIEPVTLWWDQSKCFLSIHDKPWFQVYQYYQVQQSYQY